MFISGAHAPNGPIKPEDIEAIKLGGFNGVKLMAAYPGGVEPLHTVDDIRRLKAIGIRHFAIRLLDTIWATLDEQGHRTGRRYIPSAVDYCRKTEELFLPLLEEVPDADWILDNECNVRAQWPAMWLSWANRFAGSGDWRAFMSDVLDILLFEHPDLNWAYTPMAWTEVGSEEWMHPDLIARCRKITAHSYFQSLRIDPPGTPHPPGPSPMYWLQFGANAARIHSLFPEKPIIIGEYGNSLTDRRNTPQEVPQELIHFAMRQQYGLWLAWAASTSYIEGAYLFIVGGQGWTGFNPSEAVLRALPRPELLPRLQGQSRRLSGGRAGI